MNNIVNTKHDTGSYDCSGYQREIYDGNALYEAFLKSKKGSDWKDSVQRFETNYLLHLAKIQKELKEETYEFKTGNSFILRERGKIRCITGELIEDRIVKHALCDEILTPATKKYLIYDNSASQTGKGIDFARRRLERHLHEFYMRNQSNDGYILLMDCSKYYDNLRHEEIMKRFSQYVDNPLAIRLLKKSIHNERIDVSYMSFEEYSKCMDMVFDSLEYAKIDPSFLTGEKFMSKHLNIGNQVAQNAGFTYRIPIDNYIKIIKGVKLYGAYNDDSYAIHENKDFLIQLADDIRKEANKIGITINANKTRICKLSSKWRYLQIQYSLTNTGRVIHKINPKRITAMRRKVKKLSGRLQDKEFENWYRSWLKGNIKYMGKKQRNEMDNLFKKLIEIRMLNESKNKSV